MCFRRIVLFSVLFSLGPAIGHAKLFSLDFVGRKADGVAEKRVEKKLWTRPEDSSLTEKSFPIKEWNKHFSGLGAKRAPIAVSAKDKKKRFTVEILDRKTTEFEMSLWNDRMADLHKRAKIQMDERAQIASDHQLYNRMMHDAREYRELADKLSLRDINRYQFRRNRTSDDVPTQKAGAEAK